MFLGVDSYSRVVQVDENYSASHLPIRQPIPRCTSSRCHKTERRATASRKKTFGAYQLRPLQPGRIMSEALCAVMAAAKAIYTKICQLNANREEISSLALRVNLLIGCLTTSQEVRRGDNRVNILSQIRNTIGRVQTLVDQIERASALRQFAWSGAWEKQCTDINTELSQYIQLLGVASDERQLEYLGEIQSLLHHRRKKDDDVSGQLKLLRQAVLEVQKLGHNKLQSTMSLKALHRTLVEEGEDTKPKKAKNRAKEPGAVYRGEVAPSLVQVPSVEMETAPSIAAPPVYIEELVRRAPRTPEDCDLHDLPPQIRALLEKPEYKSLMLDSSLLEYKKSKDAMSGAFGVIYPGTYLGQPIVVKKLLMKNPTKRAIKEILDEAVLMKKYNFEYFATVYGICIVDGAPAIVMKRMDSDLFCFLHQGANEGVTASLEWKIDRSIAVAAAVVALHDLKLLHRDLKSPNILVMGKKAKPLCITDFGMAQLRKEIASLRKSETAMALGKHETVGSYPWMAPGTYWRIM